MSSDKKPRGKPFEEGNPGGPGRPSATPEEKKLQRLTRMRFNSIVRKYLRFNSAELMAMAKDPATAALDLMVISVMNSAIVKGDEKKMNWFLEQLFGKLKETVKFEDDGSHFNIDDVPTEDLAKIREIMRRCKK